MISVIIPTLDAGERLPACLTALDGARRAGAVMEVIVVDGGSQDGTLDAARRAGARVLSAAPGRGGQLATGAAAASGAWLLFLHADTVLEESWAKEATAFMAGGREGAAVFSLRFDAAGLAPRIVAAGAMARTRLLKSPYGDQGLFLSRALYDRIGGYRSMPLFEDVDIVSRLNKRLGRNAIFVLRSRAVTSASRYERRGYLRCVIENAIFRMRYWLGAAPEALSKAYKR